MIPQTVYVRGTAIYEILPEVLGKGVFSEIRKGRDLRTGADMAGKFRYLLKDDNTQSSLIREKAVLEAIPANRNIVQVFFFSDQEKEVNAKTFLDTCMMMEYVSGENLLVFAFRQQLSLLQGVDIFLQCAHALEYLHGLNIAHLEIKPSNFLVDRPSINRGPIIKLTDFANAHMIDLDGTMTTELAPAALSCTIGAHPFMAPEFFSKRVLTDSMRLLFNADIFSMAVTFLTIMSEDQQPPTLGSLELGRYICYHGVFDVGAFIGGADIAKIWLKALLGYMLRENPRQRPNARELALILDWLYEIMIVSD